MSPNRAKNMSYTLAGASFGIAAALWYSVQSDDNIVTQALDRTRLAVIDKVYGRALVDVPYQKLVERLRDENCEIFAVPPTPAPMTTASQRMKEVRADSWRYHGKIDLASSFREAVTNMCVPLFNNSLAFGSSETISACINENTRNVYKYFHYYRCTAPTYASR